MDVGYYPAWDRGFVKDYFDEFAKDGQRKKAEAKVRLDILTLKENWQRTLNVTVKMLKGHEPLRELIREYQRIAYRVFSVLRGTKCGSCMRLKKRAWAHPTVI